MAIMTERLRLTEEEKSALQKIIAEAKVRHEKKRQALARRGRGSFPDLPFECSWAFEEEYRKTCRAKHGPPKRKYEF